jgi:uncharacterized protein YecE (DUF72 family)
MTRTLIGTSSWADPGFIRDWYPPDLPAKDRLAYYAERFEAVEVNATQYQLPELDTVRRWAAITPDSFTFDIKLHRLLSRHAAQERELPPDMREQVEVNSRGRVKLTEELEREVIARTLDYAAPLRKAGKMGAFLLQLTPGFAPGRSDLEELVPMLEALAPIAVEFRHRGWVEEERAESTLDFLSDHGAAFVCVDAPREVHVPIMPPIDAVTSDTLAYVRMHGRNADGYMRGKSVAERFGWIYTDEELDEIAGRVAGLGEQAAEVHVMFNNNRDDDAPTAARRFRALLGQDPGPPVGDGQQRRV